MAPLAGLQGLNAQAPQETDQGVLEAHGGPVDPSHGEYGQEYVPTWPAGYGTGYDGTQYGPQNGLEPDTSLFQTDPSRRTDDYTPSAHGSPYPKGIIQPSLEDPGSYSLSAELLARQRSDIHGTDLGAVGVHTRAVSGRESPVHYTVDRYTAPNATDLAAVPGQLRQGNNGIGRDTSQGYGVLNTTPEFQAGHSIRIVQHDTVHFDHTLDNAPPQPFWGKFGLEQATFDGPDSPYGPVGGDTTTGQQVPWEGRIGNPTAYQQPPEPTVVQSPPPGGDAWAWLWLTR